MKMALFITGLSIISANAFAVNTVSGAGMYCAADAQAAALAQAKREGAQSMDLADVRTKSADGSGKEYVVEIGPKMYDVVIDLSMQYEGSCVALNISKVPSTIPINATEENAISNAPSSGFYKQILFSDATTVSNCAALPNDVDHTKTIVCSIEFDGGKVPRKGVIVYRTNGYGGTITQAQILTLQFSN